MRGAAAQFVAVKMQDGRTVTDRTLRHWTEMENAKERHTSIAVTAFLQHTRVTTHACNSFREVETGKNQVIITTNV